MTTRPTSIASGRAATLFQALSDEKRLRILALLSRGEYCVCELTDALDLAQPLLSFHLKTLKDCGFVTDRREGRWVYYSLASAALDDAISALAELAPDPAVARRVRGARC